MRRRRFLQLLASVPVAASSKVNLGNVFPDTAGAVAGKWQESFILPIDNLPQWVRDNADGIRKALVHINSKREEFGALIKVQPLVPDQSFWESGVEDFAYYKIRYPLFYDAETREEVIPKKDVVGAMHQAFRSHFSSAVRFVKAPMGEEFNVAEDLIAVGFNATAKDIEYLDDMVQEGCEDLMKEVEFDPDKLVPMIKLTLYER